MFATVLVRVAPLAALIACSQQQALQDTAMFRGDPQHTGVYNTAGVDRLGGVLWRFQTDGPVRSSPTVSGDWVFVGSGDGQMYVLDRHTGSVRWSANVASPVNSSPAVARGLVIFGARDGTFYALDAGNGTERWRFDTGDLIPWEWGFEGWDAYTSSPVIVDSMVLFGAGDGYLYALELTGGRELWRFATEGRIRSSPAVADGVVFLGSADGRVYAVDLATGDERWRYEPEGVSHVSAEFGFDRKSIIASPAVAGGTVYVGSRDGFMYALDRATGELKWRADHSVSWAMSSPAVLDNVLFSGTSDGQFVHALDVVSGEESWRFDAAGYTWSSPAVAGNTVYIGDGGGYLRALDRHSGDERWSYKVKDGVLSSPVVAAGVVYFGSDDGAVYALTGEGRYPDLAVFWDEELRDFTFYDSYDVVRTYFEQNGYRVLDVAALGEFMQNHVADGEASVVVFAVDHVPSSVASGTADTVLFRRYLDAGGKVVWLGLPPMLLARDPDSGQPTAMSRDTSSSLIGVDFGAVNFDSYGATATDLGSEWGAPTWWVSSYSIDLSDGIGVLGLDENGRAAAWVRTHGGPSGTGFVYISAQRHTIENLAGIKAMAEYGLVEER
jgi:outer membrane protein assembly factor BamB